MWTNRIQDAPYKVIDTGIWPADFNSLTEPVWLDNERIFIHTTANYNFGRPPYQSVIYNTKTKEITAAPLSDIAISCIRDGNIMYGEKKPNGEVVAYRGTIDNAIEHQAPEPNMHVDTNYDCDWDFNESATERDVLPYKAKLYKDNFIEIFERTTRLAEHERNRWEREHGVPQVGGVLGKILYYPYEGAKGTKLPPLGGEMGIPYSEYLQSYVIGMQYYDPEEPESLSFWLLNRNGELKEVPYPTNMLIGKAYALPIKVGYLVEYNSGKFTMNDPGARGLYLISNDKIQPLIIGDVQNVRVSPNGCQVTFIHASNTSEYLSTTKPYRTLKLIDFCH